MALWLFWMADSATSFGCFLVGGGLIVVISLSGLARKPAAVHVLVLGTVFLCLFALFFDEGATLAGAMGRDQTLTGRTEFWAELLSMSENSWFGTGFESFWLGDRAKRLWEHHSWHPNQAHNGYLEVFLNLGWLGVALLGFVIARGYRNVFGALHRDRELGGLRLAFFMVAVLYNLTEAAFRGSHIIWIVFLLAVTGVPELSRRGDGIAHHAKPS
jgi:O-antigen ligase